MRRECSSWHFANVQKIHLHANHLLKSLRYLIFRYPDSVFKLETDLETDLDFFERRFLLNCWSFYKLDTFELDSKRIVGIYRR